MSYFDMISFEEASLLEGKQAEEYKARKASEKEAKDQAEKERRDRRYNPYTYRTGDKSKELFNKDDTERRVKADEMLNKDFRQRVVNSIDADRKYRDNASEELDFGTKPKFFGKKDYEKKVNELKMKHQKELDGLDKNRKNKRSNWSNASGLNLTAHDAVNRHLRRHPQSEACLEYTELTLELYNPEYIDL